MNNDESQFFTETSTVGDFPYTLPPSEDASWSRGFELDEANAWGDSLQSGNILEKADSGEKIYRKHNTPLQPSDIVFEATDSTNHKANLEQSLPFRLDSRSVTDILVQYFDKEDKHDTLTTETLELNAQDDTWSDTEFISPLDVDSTRDVWRRLTDVPSTRIVFSNSNVRREVTAIVQQWITNAKNQPSWNRPQSIQKKNRESIGPAIFGWGRTDIPAWIEPPRLSPTLNDNVLSSPTNAGTFESLKQEAANVPTTSASLVATNVSPSHAQFLAKPVVVNAASIIDLTATDVEDSFGEFQSPPTISEPFGMGQPTRSTHQGTAPIESDLLSEAVTPVARHDNLSTNAAGASSADPWDLSFFESANQTPLELKNKHMVNELVQEGPVPIHGTRPRGDSRSIREIENEATIARVVALLPDIEYLLH